MARKIALSLNNCLNLNLATLFWTPPRAQAQSLRPARGAARFRTRCAPKAGLWPWGQARCCPLSDRRTPKAGLVASGGAVLPHFWTPPRAQSWHLALGLTAGHAGATLVQPRLHWLACVRCAAGWAKR